MATKVDPAPTSLRTVTWPPCSSARRRVRARPRPVPACPRASGESICSKGSKTFSRCSSAMPMPVSQTSSASWPASAWARTPIRPPAGVNLTALESRLSSIWRARSGSARTKGASTRSTSTVRSWAAACSRTMATDSSTRAATSTSMMSAESLSASALARSRMSPTRASRWRPLVSIWATYCACLSVRGPWSWRDRIVESPMTALSGVRSSWLRSASRVVTERSRGAGSVSTEVMAVTLLVPFVHSLRGSVRRSTAGPDIGNRWPISCPHLAGGDTERIAQLDGARLILAKRHDRFLEAFPSLSERHHPLSPGWVVTRKGTFVTHWSYRVD